MEKVKIIEHVEFYCNCPYCEGLNSDEINQSNDFFIGTITCACCGKKFLGGK